MSQEPAFDFFHLSTNNGIAVLTIDRPPVNALSRELYESLDRVIDHIESTDDIRVVVIACKPDARAWIGGGDLKEFLTFTAETRQARHVYVEGVTDRFHKMSRPTIAAITKPAPGGGMSFASVCDILVAADTAFFSMPEVDRGLTGGAGGYFNRLNLPVSFIREMILTGRKLSAAELHAVGFLNYVLPEDQVMPKAMELAGLIASKSTATVRAIKESANLIDEIGWRKGRDAAHEVSASRLVDGPDYKEAISAFLERRKPIFNR